MVNTRLQAIKFAADPSKDVKQGIVAVERRNPQCPQRRDGRARVTLGSSL